MLNIFSKIIEAILPTHHSVREIRGETPAEFVRFFSPRIFINYITLSSYNMPLVKAAIHANKFHNSPLASKLLSELVKAWLKTLPWKPVIFVPIPLSKNRKLQRGYNQVTQIVDQLKNDDTILVRNLLTRNRDTPPQTSLKRKQRLHNLKNAFAYEKQNLDFSNFRVVLIDDVVTTGATMRSAYLALRPHLPKDCELLCVAVAH